MRRFVVEYIDRMVVERMEAEHAADIRASSGRLTIQDFAEPADLRRTEVFYVRTTAIRWARQMLEFAHDNEVAVIEQNAGYSGWVEVRRLTIADDRNSRCSPFWFDEND